MGVTLTQHRTDVTLPLLHHQPDLERVMGIEPTSSAWKAEVLPLNYTRLINQPATGTSFEPVTIHRLSPARPDREKPDINFNNFNPGKAALRLSLRASSNLNGSHPPPSFP
jgi:hypothetical protein